MAAIAVLGFAEDPELPVTYQVTEAQIAAEAARCDALTFDTPAAYEEGRQAIAGLRGTRVAIEERRVLLKAGLLARGRKIDAVAKDLTARIKAIEESLQAAKKLVDEEKERLKREAEERKRAELEAKVRAEREAEEARLRAGREAEEARLAEVARQQAIEADRILMEQAALDVARRAEEKRARAQREAIEAERRKAEEEQRAAAQVEADRIAHARAVEDARIAAERAQIDTELRNLAEARRAAEQAESDRLARIAAEEAAKAKATREAAEAEERRVAALDREAAARARLEALKPDVEKVATYAAQIRKLAEVSTADLPLRTREAKDVVVIAAHDLMEAAEGLDRFVEGGRVAA